MKNFIELVYMDNLKFDTTFTEIDEDCIDIEYQSYNLKKLQELEEELKELNGLVCEFNELAFRQYDNIEDVEYKVMNVNDCIVDINKVSINLYSCNQSSSIPIIGGGISGGIFMGLFGAPFGTLSALINTGIGTCVGSIGGLYYTNIKK